MNLLTLPAEILQLILGLCDPAGLRALSLTSTYVHLDANRYLYKHISVSRCKNPIALIKTALEKPQLASLVKSLDCCRWPFQHVDQDDIDFFHDHGVPPNLCAVMRYTPCWNNDMLLEILLVTLSHLERLIMDKTANFSNLDRIWGRKLLMLHGICQVYQADVSRSAYAASDSERGSSTATLRC